jgi:methyl-accepting chemotaxis protein
MPPLHETNFLALNAALEASRADEQGRGFAAVAGVAVEGIREADHSLATVVTRINTIVERVTQAATAAEEQSSVSEEINHNLTVIGDAASDLRELAQRLRGSGESLDNEVEILNGEPNRLKT